MTEEALPDDGPTDTVLDEVLTDTATPYTPPPGALLHDAPPGAPVKNLTANEQFFEGHFPFKPIMPGVLMVEALAQLACIAMLIKDEYKGKLGVFTGIDGFKFKSMAQPGDRLDMEVELVKLRGPIGKLHAIARIGDKLVCEGEISFAMVDPT